MHPALTVPESAILIPASNFEIKPNFLTEIRRHQYEGKPNECPMAHTSTFLDLCDTIADGRSLEYVQL